jgi:hypothetical protein
VIINTFRDVPYDALTLLKNILHPSHVAFTYYRTVSNRANAAYLELKVINSGKHGFKSRMEARVKTRINRRIIDNIYRPYIDMR